MWHLIAFDSYIVKGYKTELLDEASEIFLESLEAEKMCYHKENSSLGTI